MQKISENGIEFWIYTEKWKKIKKIKKKKRKKKEGQDNRYISRKVRIKQTSNSAGMIDEWIIGGKTTEVYHD